MLKDKGNKYSKLITYFIYTPEVIYIYSISLAEILDNGIPLPNSTSKDITKLTWWVYLHFENPPTPPAGA